MDALTKKHPDIILGQWGLTRGPGETDDHLRIRLKRTMQYPPTMNNNYLSLCFLLARLGIKSARRDLPVGIL